MLFGKNRGRREVAAEPLVHLSGILHIHARRNAADDGFQLSTQLLSTGRCEYFSRVRVAVGDELRLKVVSGAYAIDLRGRVESADPLHGDPDRGFVGMVSFIAPSDFERRILHNILCRLGVPRAS